MKHLPVRRPFIGTPTRALMMHWTNIVHHPDRPNHEITAGESRLAEFIRIELSKRGVDVT